MADSFSPNGAQAPAPRKRMVFTKRDPEAAAKLEAERLAGVKSNPFGDAKPREKVIAERTGKDEKDILVEDSQEYRFKLRLNPEQRAEKSTFDDEVKALKDKLAEVADDEELTAEVQGQLTAKQQEVRDLMAKFEEMIVAEAKQGTGMRPSERRAAAAAREAEQGGGGGGDRDQFGQGYGSSAAPRTHYDDQRRDNGRRGYGDNRGDNRDNFGSRDYGDRDNRDNRDNFGARGGGGF